MGIRLPALLDVQDNIQKFYEAEARTRLPVSAIVVVHHELDNVRWTGIGERHDPWEARSQRSLVLCHVLNDV